MLITKEKISALIIMLVVTLFAPMVYADWGVGVKIDSHRNHHEGHRYYRYHDRPHIGLRLKYIPSGHSSIWVGRSRYYYYDGLYYRRIGREYIIVEPPVDAYVRVIPPDFQRIMINGKTYYTDNGIFYVYTRRGYKVVPKPYVLVQPQTVVVTQAASPVVTTPVVTPPAPVEDTAIATEESFTISIPNDTGGYTDVVIKKSGNGFVGPQGEFYAEFPKVSQLKVMYGS